MTSRSRALASRTFFPSSVNRMVNRPVLALVVRVAVSLATCTFFQPDEYFQSLEVAHHAVFGYGQLTWEWLAPNPIRSIVYPALNMPVYWLLKTLSVDDTAALVGGRHPTGFFV